MLNSEAFLNGVSYESGGTSPYRTGTRYELDKIEHGNFYNGEDGDLYERQIKQLRVDLPINYADNNITSWNYVNPICFIPNNNIKIFPEQLKFGIFDLDSMKLIGNSCLTKNYGIIPEGFNRPTDVFNDATNYPPLENINYYNPGEDYFMKEGKIDKTGNKFHGSGQNLYCSTNTNFVAMPKNHAPRLSGLDTSFQVSPGNNSLTLGTVMSPKIKNFINNDLFIFNRSIIIMQIYHQEIKKINWDDFARKNPGTPMYKFPRSHLMSKIEHKYNNLFSDQTVGQMHVNFKKFLNLSEKNKYTWIYNMQKNFVAINHGNVELEHFISHLSIFKFGGNNINYPTEKGKVRLRELSNNDIEIVDPGCFTLLPTMMSEDLFTVRTHLQPEYTRTTNEDGSKISHNNKCASPTANYDTNATNCAFRGKANMWQQHPSAGKNNPNFVPNMFNNNIFNIYGIIIHVF